MHVRSLWLEKHRLSKEIKQQLINLQNCCAKVVKPPEMEELAALHGDTDFTVNAHIVIGKKELLGQRKWKIRGFYSRQVVKSKLIADLTDN